MRSFTAFKSDQRGNVLMLTGLAILILFAVAGAGVDFGRQQLVRMKLQNASDAAAIAAASLPESTSSEQRRAVALRYYNLNFPSSYLGVARPTPNIQVGGQIVVDASTSMNANFVSNVGVERLEAQGRTVVDRVAAQNSIYDVILVMDNSQSMANTTTAPSFTASTNRTNAQNLGILRCRPELDNIMRNSWCGSPIFPNNGRTVPMGDGTSRTYASVQNCRDNASNHYCARVSPSQNISSGNYFTARSVTYYPRGFAVDATGTRLAALRSVALNFVDRIIDEGSVGSRIGTVTWSSAAISSLPLTTNGDTVRSRIHDMSAWGATNPYLAMQHASTLANSFASDHIKAVVLMTDGKPTLLGASAPDSSNCNGQDYCAPSASATLPICTQLKNAGVQVYTVGFLNPGDAEFQGNSDYARVQTFLRGCASVDGEGNPRYYSAQDGAQLEQAFTQILTSLGRIRISQ